ncbi:MAG: hypothetical protein EBU90_03875 [Proteobacteria bacterium]|nr:hypothetical protein [Pseudomonadota bacterium]NBP14208.1 hypothetical protein [bacterium]
MFEFLFGKKQAEEPKNNIDILASITYYVASSGTPMIDISLGDYETNSIEALCKLLDILSKDACYLETLEMIKSGLVKEHKEEALLKVFTHVSQQAGKKILKVQQESIQDQPCIRPSDMLR